MGRHQAIPFFIHPVAPGQQGVFVTPIALMNVGCNLQVEVATASAFVNNVASPSPRRSLTVMSHLDTGASRTSISPVIAEHLGLIATGVAFSQTANGSTLNPTYAIDLLFGASTLTARLDLSVGSCTLPFDLQALAGALNDPRNIGILIGRDVLSAWHLMWDGPTSTVIISD